MHCDRAYQVVSQYLSTHKRPVSTATKLRRFEEERERAAAAARRIGESATGLSGLQPVDGAVSSSGSGGDSHVAEDQLSVATDDDDDDEVECVTAEALEGSSEWGLDKANNNNNKCVDNEEGEEECRRFREHLQVRRLCGSARYCVVMGDCCSNA